MAYNISSNNQNLITKHFYTLGTVISLSVYGEKAGEAVEEAIFRLADIDNKMSVFKSDSEIARINTNAGGSPQKISKDTYFVIKTAVEYSILSCGAFNPTIRPLIHLWGIGTSNPKVPSADEIKSKLELVNYKDICVCDNDSTIRLNHKNQSLDLGGIAKGYAADEVRNIFIKNNIASAIIDLGGNIFAYGSKPDGTPWKIGLQDPLSPRGYYVGVLRLQNKSVVTSGNYERYFEDNGRIFHHILDPRTGYPSENGVISTTILSVHSIDGDALSTCAYVMGINHGMKLVESLEGIEAVFITADKKIYLTSGLKENFQISNKDYLIYT
jgi:thiamine biosynthesis lipoprotein